MKISIEKISKDLGEEILIRCHEIDEEIYKILSANQKNPNNFEKSLKLTGSFFSYTIFPMLALLAAFKHIYRQQKELIVYLQFFTLP